MGTLDFDAPFPFVAAGFSQLSGLDDEMMELVTRQNGGTSKEIAAAGVLFTFLVGRKLGWFSNKSHTKTHKEWESHGWVAFEDRGFSP